MKKLFIFPLIIALLGSCSASRESKTVHVREVRVERHLPQAPQWYSDDRGDYAYHRKAKHEYTIDYYSHRPMTQRELKKRATRRASETARENGFSHFKVINHKHYRKGHKVRRGKGVEHYGGPGYRLRIKV